MKRLRLTVAALTTLFPQLFYSIPRANWMLEHPEKFNDEDYFKFALKIIEAERKASWTNVDAAGVEKLPEKGGYLLCANHQGKFDALGISLCMKRPFSILWAKDSASRILARQIKGLLKCTILDLHDVKTFFPAINSMAEALAQGRPYLVFPEGKYGDNKNNLQEFQSGCFKAAYMSKVPVIPVALYDSYKAMDTNKLFVKETVRIRFMDPIPYDEYREINRKSLSELVKDRIQGQINLLKQEFDK